MNYDSITFDELIAETQKQDPETFRDKDIWIGDERGEYIHSLFLRKHKDYVWMWINRR